MQKCLVIGGGGFLGQHIVDRLLTKGFDVSIFDMRVAETNPKVKIFIGNLCNTQELLPALRGIDTVFHCATPSPLSGNRQVFMAVNYEGTKTIIAACLSVGVKKLVLTSSASVVYEGKDICNGDETLPYASKPMDFYTETKILQEKVVLEANSEKLCTVALRPHGLFGPRDPHMLPTTIRMARAGKTKFIIGNGKNKVDFTYIENVAEAHVLAAEVIKPGSKAGGKAYNITNDETVLFWDFMRDMLVGLNYPAPRYNLPYWLVYYIAVLLRFLSKLLSPVVNIQPTFTPTTVSLAGTHHYYSCERAKTDLGYKPVISMRDGIKKTIAHFQHLTNENNTNKKSH